MTIPIAIGMVIFCFDASLCVVESILNEKAKTKANSKNKNKNKFKLKNKLKKQIQAQKQIQKQIQLHYKISRVKIHFYKFEVISEFKILTK